MQGIIDFFYFFLCAVAKGKEKNASYLGSTGFLVLKYLRRYMQGRFAWHKQR